VAFLILLRWKELYVAGMIPARGDKMAILSLVVSVVAVCLSLVALWKGYFAPFSPLSLAGNLGFRVYPFSDDKERWFVASFDIPIIVTNAGAKPGFVIALRLRLHFPELPFADNYELVFPNWELNPEKVNLIDQNRMTWIDEVVLADFSPFVVLPKATVVKHLTFETRWDKPVVQKRVIASLEMRSDRSATWKKVTQWEFAMDPWLWVDLEHGKAFIFHPAEVRREQEVAVCSPADLHNYTGTKAPLPEKGGLSSMGPSHLDHRQKEQEEQESKD
jgi:hypothetical protein